MERLKHRSGFFSSKSEDKLKVWKYIYQVQMNKTNLCFIFLIKGLINNGESDAETMGVRWVIGEL